MKIKRICLYGILTAAAMMFSFLEGFLDLSFIAPGVKLGLANSVALLLIFFGDFRGAFYVTAARVSLSSILFGTPVTFLFSVTAGIISVAVMAFLRKIGSFSHIFISIAGGATHNIIQCAVAAVILNTGSVFAYLPLLIIFGVICGTAVGLLCWLLHKNKTINKLFKECL